MKILIAVIALLLVPFAIQAKGGSTEMTYEQYQVELAALIQREKTAREEIAKEQALIESLRQTIAETGNRIAAVIQAKYTLLGITEQDVFEAENELSLIRSALDRFIFLSPEEIVKRGNEISALETRFSAIKAKKVSWLFRIAKKVDEIEPVIAQVRNLLQQASTRQKAPIITPASKNYRVTGAIGSTNLSIIAAEVYGSQYEWPRIYRANKRLIDKGFAAYKNALPDPKIQRPQDFLRPGWDLIIP